MSFKCSVAERGPLLCARFGSRLWWLEWVVLEAKLGHQLDWKCDLLRRLLRRVSMHSS